MNLEIQKVGPARVEELHNILEKCGQDMQVCFGLDHWVPAYPLHLMRVKLHEFYHHLGYQQRGVFRFNTKLYGETGAVFFEKILKLSWSTTGQGG